MTRQHTAKGLLALPIVLSLDMPQSRRKWETRAVTEKTEWAQSTARSGPACSGSGKAQGIAAGTPGPFLSDHFRVLGGEGEGRSSPAGAN